MALGLRGIPGARVAAGLLLLCAASIGGGAARAGTSSFGPDFSTVNGGSAQIDFTLSVDKLAVGPASLTITVLGDLDAAPDETVHVLVDGVEVAAFNQDQCNINTTPQTRTITIDAATLAPLIADGQIVLRFRTGPQLNTLCTPAGVFAAGPNPFSLAVMGTLTYEGGNAQPVKTVQTIGNFLGQRNNQILSNGPDEGRQIDRLMDFGRPTPNSNFNNTGTAALPAPGSPVARGGETPDAGDFARMRGGNRVAAMPSMYEVMALGNPQGGNPFPYSPTSAAPTLGYDPGPSTPVSIGGPVRLFGIFEDAMRFTFSTSLRDIARYAAESETSLREEEMGLGMKGRRTTTKTWYNPLDVWVDVRYASFRDGRAGNDYGGHFGMATLGADYVVNPRLLVGALVQFDSMRQKSDTQSTDIRGEGWMFGPYATLRLSQHLFLQGRTAWGRSNNEVSPLMTYTDKFSSDRWLASMTLAGRWVAGPWTYKPALSVGYMEDMANGYTDSTGAVVPNVRATLGQAKAGPEVSYRYQWTRDVMLEPHAGAQLIWNFADGIQATAINSLNGEAAGPAGLRGRTELGLRAVATGGIIVDVSGAYDGIGAGGYNAMTGRAVLRIPLR